MSENDPDPADLRALGSRLDEVRRREDVHTVRQPPTSLGIAFRFSTELFAATIVGAAIGWGLDRLFKTSPVLMFVFGVLGAAAGVRNVIRAAREINTQTAAAKRPNEEK